MISELWHINNAIAQQEEITHKHPDDSFIIEWIERSAPEFRNDWEKSQCKYCISACSCGHLLKVDCNLFKWLRR